MYTLQHPLQDKLGCQITNITLLYHAYTSGKSTQTIKGQDPWVENAWHLIHKGVGNQIPDLGLNWSLGHLYFNNSSLNSPPFSKCFRRNHPKVSWNRSAYSNFWETNVATCKFTNSILVYYCKSWQMSLLTRSSSLSDLFQQFLGEMYSMLVVCIWGNTLKL